MSVMLHNSVQWCSKWLYCTPILYCSYKPQRTLYLAFGHDEEVSGILGAGQIASKLQNEGVQLEFILDEGGTVLVDGLKGIAERPLAMVGTAEKVIIR